MRTREEVIDFALSLPGAYLDYPFHDDTAVLRHTANKKAFMLLIHHKARLYVNVKCDPMKADLYRDSYSGVIPGYHMNKTHWNSLFLNSDVPDFEIKGMIEESYDLTKPKRRVPKNSEL